MSVFSGLPDWLVWAFLIACLVWVACRAVFALVRANREIRRQQKTNPPPSGKRLW